MMSEGRGHHHHVRIAKRIFHLFIISSILFCFYLLHSSSPYALSKLHIAGIDRRLSSYKNLSLVYIETSSTQLPIVDSNDAGTDNTSPELPTYSIPDESTLHMTSQTLQRLLHANTVTNMSTKYSIMNDSGTINNMVPVELDPQSKVAFQEAGSVKLESGESELSKSIGITDVVNVGTGDTNTDLNKLIDTGGLINDGVNDNANIDASDAHSEAKNHASGANNDASDANNDAKTLIDPGEVSHVDVDGVADVGNVNNAGNVSVVADNVKDDTTIIHQAAADVHDVADTRSDSPDAVAVILLTYMRSGSSLTGDIMQHSKKVFYVFEPFRVLYNVLERKTINFMNGTKLLPGKYDRDEVHRQAMIGWLTCDFKLVYVLSFQDDFLRYGTKTTSIVNCIKSAVTNKLLSQRARDKCIQDLEDKCKRSKYRIVKTIRTSFPLAMSIQKQVPNLKIIHLVRDPRSTVVSQLKRAVCPQRKGGIIGCANKLCGQVSDDTFYKNSYSEERTLTVKYEDLSTQPVTITKSMYNFVGINFTEADADYAYRLTLGGDRKDCLVCQAKWQLGQAHESSVKHIASWKTNMNQATLSAVQRSCKRVMDYYKYEMFYTHR